LIDSDLEEEPELVELFWQEINSSQNIDMVFGVQRKRKGGWFEKISGWLYYKIFNFFSDEPICPNLIIARLMTKQYVENLIKFKEREHTC
jgi:putative glycosyltransferase